jgi:hypothetical protein
VEDRDYSDLHARVINLESSVRTACVRIAQLESHIELLEILQRAVDVNGSMFGTLSFNSGVVFNNMAEFNSQVNFGPGIHMPTIRCDHIDTMSITSRSFREEAQIGRERILTSFTVGDGIIYDRDTHELSLDQAMLTPDDYADIIADNKELEEENVRLNSLIN